MKGDMKIYGIIRLELNMGLVTIKASYERVRRLHYRRTNNIFCCFSEKGQQLLSAPL